MSRVPLDDNKMLELDSSNIKQAEDSDIFIWNEKLATLDRNFETQLNLDDSVVVSNPNNQIFRKQAQQTNEKPESNNFTFNVKNSELIFNKKKKENVNENFQKWKESEQEKKEKEQLLENIRLSGFKQSKEFSEGLESSLKTGESSRLKKKSGEDSRQASEKQSQHMSLKIELQFRFLNQFFFILVIVPN